MEDMRGAFMDKVIGINKRLGTSGGESEQTDQGDGVDVKDDLRNVDSRIDDMTS